MSSIPENETLGEITVFPELSCFCYQMFFCWNDNRAADGVFFFRDRRKINSSPFLSYENKVRGGYKKKQPVVKNLSAKVQKMNTTFIKNLTAQPYHFNNPK